MFVCMIFEYLGRSKSMDHVEKQIEIGVLCSTPSHSEIDREDESREEEKKQQNFISVLISID